MDVYVYALEGTPEALRPWVNALGEPVYHWVADAARLEMGTGIPADWEDQGAVFGPMGELRWWRVADGSAIGYQTLLLVDAPVDGLPPLPGEWKAQDENCFLQNLNDRKLNPNFDTYPHGTTSGRFRAKVYYRNGIATFISPRELVGEGGPDAER
ncbi:hypothetical protein [uncultured Chloroflexus sp.]|uniref:hypothetical protein n=1 Tax=uncultured Chloroflexus sp. TaxID=214040 RepID=UPI00262BC5B4|nr:hypothetical protein [uncultured Chloroflexus sp.]